MARVIYKRQEFDSNATAERWIEHQESLGWQVSSYRRTRIANILLITVQIRKDFARVIGGKHATR